MADERPSWLTPLLILVGAFCAGIQLALLLQMLGGNWAPEDLPMQLATFAVMVACAWLLLSPERRGQAEAWLRGQRERTAPSAEQAPPPPPPVVREPAPAAAPMRSLPPPPMAKAAPPATAAPAKPKPAPVAQAPARPALAPVKMSLESPLARGPVWPPGEPIPITIQVRMAGPGEPGDIDIEIEVQHSKGTQRARLPLKGSVAVVSQAVPSPGPFVITARAIREGGPVSETQVQGYASSYREEIGRRFDALKEACGAHGLEVGAESTPRELRDALAHKFPGLRKNLDELVGALEVALYSEEEVGRETYEALVRALTELEKRGLEASTRA